MNAFGLTGNIGCGKSTVASLLAQYSDVQILDCDSLGKEIIQSGSYREEINAILGLDTFPNGVADLKRIAKIIFSDAEKKRRFEALIHPLVWAEVARRVAAADGKLCVVESAIIYETNSESLFAAVIVVTCNREEQIRRLAEDRQLSAEQIRARLGQQLPSEGKEARAQFVISTDCPLEQLQTRVETLYQSLKQFKGVMTWHEKRRSP